MGVGWEDTTGRNRTLGGTWLGSAHASAQNLEVKTIVMIVVIMMGVVSSLFGREIQQQGAEDKI